jgi:hypothetical protein
LRLIKEGKLKGSDSLLEQRKEHFNRRFPPHQASSAPQKSSSFLLGSLSPGGGLKQLVALAQDGEFVIDREALIKLPARKKEELAKTMLALLEEGEPPHSLMTDSPSVLMGGLST